MSSEDGPGVAFHPPFLVLGLAVAGWMLFQEAPLPFLPGGLARPLGILLGLASLGISGWAVATLVRAGTNVPTHLPAKSLVRRGPYRFSRNPIYLGLALGFAALAAWLNTAWFLVVDVLFVSLITAGVIVREERYLLRKFGAAYAAYRADVRRWL